MPSLTITASLRVTLVGLLIAHSNAQQTVQQINSACLIAQQNIRTHTIRQQVVSINTYAESNTTFYAIPEVAVTVTNAPTSFDGTTTFEWTEARVPRSQWRSQNSATSGLQSSTIAAAYGMTTVSPMDDYYIITAMGARVANAKRQAPPSQALAAVSTLSMNNSHVSS